MPQKSLRDYLGQLDEAGMLRRVSVEVDPTWEIGAIMRHLFSNATSRYAVLFENVKGADYPCLVGAFSPSRAATALALDAASDRPEDVFAACRRGFANLTEPVEIDRSEAKCKQVVLQGDEVDLGRLPIPTWSAGRDAGPYITCGSSITADPDTGVQNMGVYRLQVKGARKTAFGAGYTDGMDDYPADRGAVHHYQKYEARGQAMPVAVALGNDPVIFLASAFRGPIGYDEIRLAGGLRGTGIEVVRAETSDLLVPANSELIIEGVVRPGVREPEGPVGEAAGYMTGTNAARLVLEVSCITMREGAIVQGLLAQMPPAEASLLLGVFHEATIFKRLKEDIGIPGILDVAHLRASGNLHLVVKMRPSYAGHQVHVLNAAWTALKGGTTTGKIIAVVDDDIDIENPSSVLWAYATRVRPDRDVYIVPNTPIAHGDLSVADDHSSHRGRPGSRLLIDATKKYHYPDVALPLPEYSDRVKDRWAEYGLPPI